MLHRILTNLPEPRDIFSRTLTKCISSNPRSARWIVALMALYLHLGPYSRYVLGQIEQRMAALDVAPAPRRPLADRPVAAATA
jgi:hypothetical protein